MGGSCFQLYAVIRLEIDQCISGFLLARGDPAVIGYLNSLKDRLRRIRRRATSMIQEAQAGVAQESGQVNLPHIEPTQMNANFGNRPSQVVNRSANLDYVFTDTLEDSNSCLLYTSDAADE